MRKSKLNTTFRIQLSDKLMDLGNYVAIGLVFGQFVTSTFSVDVFIIGFAFTLICYIMGYILIKYG